VEGKRPVKTTMIVPESTAGRGTGEQQRLSLTLGVNHSMFDDPGVLLDHNGEVLNGFKFRVFRDRLGAWIETTNPATVCMALEVPLDEPGITAV